MKKLFAIILLAFFLTPQFVEAASLSPSVMEVSALRGSVLTKEFTVFNAGETEQTYYLGVIKFEPTPDGKSPAFIPYEQDHLGLPEWISFDSTEITVEAHGQKQVGFTIAVPQDEVAGGYYAAITVSASPAELVASNGAIVQAKTAMLVLLTIEGETMEGVQLLDFTDANASIRSTFSGRYTYRLQNQGNVHVTPVGTITFQNMFGSIISTQEINQTGARILPGSTRIYEELLQDDVIGLARYFTIGPVKATLHLVYGNSNQSIEAETSFWYVSNMMIIIAVILLLVLIKVFFRKKVTVLIQQKLK